MKRQRLAIIGFSLIVTIQLCSQGYIVPNGVTYGGSLPGGTIHVVQNPTNLNHTGFSLVAQGANMFLFSPFLDEGVRTFSVSLGQPISLQPILANSYTELVYPNNYVFEEGVPVYVGLYTGEIFPQNGIYPNPLFGWARLVNDQGVIRLLDGALEYGGGGIFAGTQTVIVPEPSTICLFGLGALLLGWRVLCKRR